MTGCHSVDSFFSGPSDTGREPTYETGDFTGYLDLIGQYSELPIHRHVRTRSIPAGACRSGTPTR
jgi:hypothetical protein